MSPQARKTLEEHLAKLRGQRLSSTQVQQPDPSLRRGARDVELLGFEEARKARQAKSHPRLEALRKGGER